MSELWAPWKYVVSFNPHIPLKTISMVFFLPYYPGGFPRWYSGECIHLSMQETKEMWVQSLGREILWRRKCLPTRVFLPGKFHGQRSLESSSLWGGKELYMTERLTHTHTHTHTCAGMYLTFILSMGRMRPRTQVKWLEGIDMGCKSSFSDSSPYHFNVMLTQLCYSSQILQHFWSMLSWSHCSDRWSQVHQIFASSHQPQPPSRAVCVQAQSLQSCLTLCDPMDCSPPSSSVHGILQARILEWVAVPSSGDLPNPASLMLLHWQAESLPLVTPEKPL